MSYLVWFGGVIGVSVWDTSATFTGVGESTSPSGLGVKLSSETARSDSLSQPLLPGVNFFGVILCVVFLLGDLRGVPLAIPFGASLLRLFSAMVTHGVQKGSDSTYHPSNRVTRDLLPAIIWTVRT